MKTKRRSGRRRRSSGGRDYVGVDASSISQLPGERCEIIGNVIWVFHPRIQDLPRPADERGLQAGGAGAFQVLAVRGNHQQVLRLVPDFLRHIA